MRCIAATTKLILFAAATNALAPVASMAKSKTHKKRSTHDPEGAFNCPGASPSPLHAIDATLPQD